MARLACGPHAPRTAKSQLNCHTEVSHFPGMGCAKVNSPRWHAGSPMGDAPVIYSWCNFVVLPVPIMFFNPRCGWVNYSRCSLHHFAGIILGSSIPIASPNYSWCRFTGLWKPTEAFAALSCIPSLLLWIYGVAWTLSQSRDVSIHWNFQGRDIRRTSKIRWESRRCF